MKALTYYIWLVAMCSSISFGAFDYVISNSYYNNTLTLNSESVQVTGAGVYEIIANGKSYIEVQNTLPLKYGIGGVSWTKMYGTSTATLNGGEFEYFNTYDDSVVNITGGKITSLWCYGNSDVTLSGGSLKYLRLAYSGSTDDWQPITFVCDLDSLVIDRISVENGRIRGNWLDGTSFDIGIILPDRTLSRISFIPEPATMLLLGLGGLLIRRKK